MRTKRGPQKFSEEFRRAAVRRGRESVPSGSARGAGLGGGETTLRQWLHAIPAGKATAPGRVLSLEEEVRRLRRDNERLREEREILKKATAFFAKESK